MADKKINGRVFRTPDTLLATEAIRLQIRLMRVIGHGVENIPAIFAGRSESATDAQKSASDAAAIQAIANIFAKADPDEVTNLISDICEIGMISNDGRNFDPIIFDNDFSGQNGKDLFPVLIFFLKETLGDFFSGVLGSGGLAQRARD